MDLDVTKCNSEQCLHKESCFRYTAKPNPRWQSCADFADDCRKYEWRNKKEVSK